MGPTRLFRLRLGWRPQNLKKCKWLVHFSMWKSYFLEFPRTKNDGTQQYRSWVHRTIWTLCGNSPRQKPTGIHQGQHFLSDPGTGGQRRCNFLATNYTGKRTQHINAKYHFIRNYVEDGTVKIQFVKTEENLADTFTKNQTTAIFKKSTDALLTNIGFQTDPVSGGVSE